jgi:hypothetical protein
VTTTTKLGIQRILPKYDITNTFKVGERILVVFLGRHSLVVSEVEFEFGKFENCFCTKEDSPVKAIEREKIVMVIAIRRMHLSLRSHTSCRLL